VNLQLWDTSGQDAFRDLVSLYYRDSHAAVLVFDYTNPESLKNLKYWLKELDDRVSTHDIVIKIAGNKHDLIGQSENPVTEEDIQSCLREFNIQRFEVINTCALTGEGIYPLFEKIAEECFAKFAR